MRFSLSLGLIGCLLVVALITSLGPYSDTTMLLPDQGDSWYYWKLATPNFWTHFTAWGFYTLHQASLWWLIACAQRQRPDYSSSLHPINIAAISVNLFFVLLHIFQTKIWYDGLAQDVSVWSSQFSVIFMLVFVLVMENGRRGIVFGKSSQFINDNSGFLRRYHGYYFSWAIIYTFWFHPIEDNLGHLLGTFYTLMLMLQGSLFFTRFHTNRKWTLLLETFVILHGTLVAYMTAREGHWRMFLWGFIGLFIITQMHGIGLKKSIKWLLAIVFIAGVLISYRYDPEAMTAVLRIPGAELLLAVICAAIFWALKKWLPATPPASRSNQS